MWKKWRKYVTAETVCSVIIISIAFYLMLKKRGGWYPYKGINYDVSENLLNRSTFKIKSPGGKRTSKGEEKARQILEKIFGKPFPSIRPDFLKNPTTGKNLEIDCYNEELRLGVEIDGKQHSEFVPHFHRSKKEFLYQVAKDDYKKKKCQLMGITLINIPHFVHIDDMERYLRIKLIKAGKLL